MAMKILIGSRLFPPSCGGMETVMSLLAEEFSRLGHEVVVVTETPAENRANGYEVVRCRSYPRAKLRWCDVVVQSCMSLQQILPLSTCLNPTLVIHHTWYRRTDGRTDMRDVLKRFLCRFTENVSVSSAIAKHLSVPSDIIPNPYDDDLFRMTERGRPDIDIIFAGRLVSDKGVDILLRALKALKVERGMIPKTVIVGAGPEERALQELARSEGLDGDVEFLGQQSPPDVAALLRRARVLVVPSRWEEPFGVVALEGIASGCFCIGSDGGGLPEAIGKCGIIFPRNDARALTDALYRTLSSADELLDPTEAEKHLLPHRKRIVAERYLAKLQGLLA